jgi:conjugative relaxase-like TrwC/TraI family protein
VLVMRRLWAGAARYFLSAVGPDGGDTPRRGEAPGRWAGAGAGTRGLAGPVDGATLRAVLPDRAGRVAGFDLTFAAPKSLSVLHALCPGPVSDAVRRAHDNAVDAGLAYLERHACAVRVGREVVTADGLVVAGFRHRTSRASDPHLHTHALVVNLARGPDARDRALHTPLLYAERRGAAATYHVVLRGHLTLEAGLTWEPPRDGRCDARAVPVAVRAAFSRRRAAVLNEAAGELADRRWAERVTRPERSGLVDFDRLSSDWRRRAGVLCWSPPGPERGRVPQLRALGDDVLPGADRWRRADLLVAIADRWVDGARAADLADATDRWLASPEVLAVGRRFTTRAALARADATAAALRGRWVDGDLDSLDRLRREVALDGRRLLVVVGDAAAAQHAHARVGAHAVPSAIAAAAIARLRPDDVAVIRSPEDLPSAHVAAALGAAHRGGVVVLAGSRGRAGVSAAVPDALPVTVPVPGGDVTTSTSAATAAQTAISDWMARRRAGAAAVLVAAAEEVSAINTRARAALRAGGLLGPTEVGGFAAGDVVRFTRGRPARGIGRQACAEVVAVDVVRGRLDARLEDGRRLALSLAQLRGVVHAHVVPPSLVADRGDVFVIGGPTIAPRHLGANHLHRYVTAPIPERSHHLAATRHVDLGVGLSR